MAWGSRQEIDLVPPRPASDEAPALPEPVTPQGIVSANFDEGFKEPPAPGQSPLDAGLARLQPDGASEGGAP